jgi:lipid A ethanolaminephosphotransferase
MLKFLSPLLSPRIGIHRLILLLAVIFTLLFNHSFFSNLYSLYGASLHGLAFIASLGLLLFALQVLLLCVLCFRFTTKVVLTILLIGGASASYYMGRFNIVVDSTMLTNVLQTDAREVKDLLSFALLADLVILGLLPCWWLWRTSITYCRWTLELRNRLLLMVGSLALALASALPFTADYASFLREQKLLRYYANPVTFVYSSVRLAHDMLAVQYHGPRIPTGINAHKDAADTRRNLVILVVGEAARADHFSLNGYSRDTNPLLAKEDVIFFTQVTSCGTDTAYSVPCMFSLSDRKDFSLEQAAHTENLLDVLQHAGVAVLWRDNNSDSKGVAQAVEFQDFRNPTLNTRCEVECRDVGMLDGLDQWMATHPNGDYTIVLHQMGNHGPAYYKRYPPEFRQFQPECTSNQLETCARQEIINSYDNALLYTDFFLSQVIAFLKQHDDNFDTALLYVSDHGESLGENGIYLHGLPFMLAPATQTHVGALMWLGANYPVDRNLLRQRAMAAGSHDDYFHTVLGLLNIQTPEYDAGKDWLAAAAKH